MRCRIGEDAAAPGIEAPAQAGVEAPKPVADAGTEDAGRRAEELMNHKQLKNAVSDLNKQLKNTEAVLGFMTRQIASPLRLLTERQKRYSKSIRRSRP